MTFRLLEYNYLLSCPQIHKLHSFRNTLILCEVQRSKFSNVNSQISKMFKPQPSLEVSLDPYVIIFKLAYKQTEHIHHGAPVVHSNFKE